ncbi:uncharacterized protein GGS22DRAFT_156399 [Annulohypoxylon maeteangense]|uniref:uncharacterized protein n=1 Tax=Annulohypoxylon maeteangense TaxID=1927788 RepID=UPI0020076BD4|nr:uncharacterized protein GGS22DRAFT_156399 [Annulohypoxylon maeteangense]KAI0887193.1 hypothetical protein GGS22DRAFT_156399 [Annulohypoxylon maeteangense]
MDADHIDKLLERYLHLLHEYTALRDQLSSLQTGMYQTIARANFAAERGLRFGQDHYDERMQASRRVMISKDDDQESSVPVFTVTAEPKEPEKEVVTDDKAGDVVGEEEEEEKKEVAVPEEKIRRKDPLRWFGLLTPMALRQAQAQSIEAVEQVIPRLVSVNAEMAQVEIEVRRARKKRAKAEAAAAKKEQEVGLGAEVAV